VGRVSELDCALRGLVPELGCCCVVCLLGWSRGSCQVLGAAPGAGRRQGGA
jgi:hypothetical protein